MKRIDTAAEQRPLRPRWGPFVTAGILPAVLACSPQPTVRPRALSLSHDAPRDAESVQRSLSDPSGTQNEPCGMPTGLSEPDWPRVLLPVSRGEPPLGEPGTTTLAIFPDTQYYTSCRSPHFHEQVEWVSNQVQRRNIAFAVSLGDLTEHNTNEEWHFVADALRPLRERIPLFLTTGNHDYGHDGRANVRETLFQKHFSDPGPPTRAVTSVLKNQGDWENAYYRVPLRGSVLGILLLEWSPRTTTVAWAQEVLSTFPEDRVLFVTHAYLYYDSSRYDWARYGPAQKWNPRAYGTALKNPEGPSEEGNWSPEGAYDGEMLWQELLRDHPGVFLTLNGHVLGDGTGHKSERALHGNLVHQVLANYQMLDKGGLGYLRLLEIAPDGASLRMRTYSPTLDMTATGADQDFELAIDPPLW